MSWSEFKVLLSGLMSYTPLGKIISIRSEDNPDIIRNFSKNEINIRNKWRYKQAKKVTETMSIEEMNKQVELLQKAFKETFS